MEDFLHPQACPQGTEEVLDASINPETRSVEQQDNRLAPPPAISQHTRYHGCSGEIYESAQGPIHQSDNPAESNTIISEPNFLELIRSSESSGQELALRGDQSPTSSDSSGSTIRDIQPRTLFFETQPGSHHFILINTINMAWASNAAFRGFVTDRWGPPVGAEKNGLYSMFKEKFPEDQNTLKSGQKISDQKMWEEGFDTGIFALSNRAELQIRKRDHIFCSYKLRGIQKTAQEYNTENLAYLRRKLAWNEINDALNQETAKSSPSTEFEKVATDFFRGHAVEAEYETSTASVDEEPKPYSLTRNTGDRTKVLQENPLADKTLVLFLEDIVMANEMEKACVTKDTFHGLKVYRHDNYNEILSELRKAPLSSDIMAVVNMTTGATVRFQDPKRLSEALEAAGLIPGGIADVKGPVSDTNAGQSEKAQENSGGLVVEDHSTHSTEVLGQLDVSEATLHTVQSAELPNTPGDSSALNSISSRQESTVEGASTGLSDLSTDISELPADEEHSNIHDDSANLNRPTVPRPEIIENSDSCNSLSNHKPAKSTARSKVPDSAGTALRTGFNDDKIDAAEVEATNSTPAIEPGSIKKKKRGSKRKTVHKGKGAKNTAEPSSSQSSQAPTHAIVSPNQPSETFEKLNSRAPSGAHSGSVESLTENGNDNAEIPQDDKGWKEVKTKVSRKSKRSKGGESHGRSTFGHGVPPPIQDQTIRSREFNPEEYTAISSNPPTFKATDGQPDTVRSVTENAAVVHALENLPAEEVEAIQVLSREAQYSIAPSGPRDARNGHASMNDTHNILSEHHPEDESIAAVGEILGEEVDVATELHDSSLEWAAADLTSPTKFSSRWRHSSFPYRGTTPSQDEFEEPIEILTTRRRSNSTTILDPRVRAVQFGDFPVPVEESLESESAPQSACPSVLSLGIPNEPLIYYEPTCDTSTIPVFAGTLMTSTGVRNQLNVPVPAQIPQAQHASHMFMPPSYPPPGYLAAGPDYRMGYPNQHFVSYGPPISGFACPPRHMLSFNAGHVGNHSHPTPLTYDCPPHTITSPNIASHDHQLAEQASQQEGDNDESFTSRSRSDESFETQSNIDQQTAPSASPQAPPAHAGYRCSCCFQGAIPSEQKPLYFCPGCGPPCAIRYCSAACLLAHSYQHSQSCMNYAYYQRMDPHNMPPEVYEWERNYLAPIDLDTPERYRQRAFSMFCYQGPFPRVLKAWAIQHTLPVGLTGCDANESFKQTGDYHIFRSAVSADGKKFAPVEIICTLRLRRGDPMKVVLNRALNACFLVCDSRVVNFLFRLLRHLILDLDTWSLMMPVLDQRTIHAEFIHQFSLEFNFDAAAHADENNTFSLTREWQQIRSVLEGLENEHKVLHRWFRATFDDIRSPRNEFSKTE